MPGKLVFSTGLLALFLTLQSSAHAEPVRGERPRRQFIWPEETGSMPRGFHVETRPRCGPIIGGAITAGFGGLLLATGLQQRAEANASKVQQTPGTGGEFLIIPGVISLAVGLPVLAYGLLSRRAIYVRGAAPPLQVGFSLDPRSVAAGLTYAL
jgi:hypothetical protein